MGRGLGDVGNPAALIPGDVGSVEKAASDMAAYGDVLYLAGQGLARIDTGAGWTGQAADAFRRVYQSQPGKWTQAGEAFHEAANAIGSYSSVLQWAQGQAAYAIQVWNSGTANHQAAQQILDNARSQLDRAGNTAAATVNKAASLAPPKPGFWSQVGGFFSGVGHGAEAVGDGLVNGLASFGNAVIQHPGATAAAVGGTMLAGISAAGDAGGLVLDATGVGAVAGAPLNVVSTAGVAVGIGIAGASLGTLAADAAGPDRVTLMQSSSGSGSGSDSGPEPNYSDKPRSDREPDRVHAAADRRCNSRGEESARLA
jgi:hypothetical protein